MNEKNLNLVKGSLSRKRQTVVQAMEPAEHTQEELNELFESRIASETELPPMQPLLDMFGVPCFYRGELVANCGKAKSGKTFFLSILMSACLTQETLALKRHTETGDSPKSTDIKPLRVLWVDTEQSKQSTQEILRDRIITLSNIDQQASEFNDYFYAFNLRGLGFEMRNKMQPNQQRCQTSS